MANRNYYQQGLHDRVIAVAAQYLSNNNYKIYTNPNGQHNTRIGDLYPDIILTPFNNNQVQFIIEVETDDSVNFNEARQWQQYATLGGTFYLLVPAASRVLAGNICMQLGIPARFGTYVVDPFSQQLTINYE